MLTLDEAKEYLRLNSDDSSGLAESLLAASSEYLNNAGAVDDGKLYNLAQRMLIAHWHDKREPEGRADRLHFGLSGIILQLQTKDVV